MAGLADLANFDAGRMIQFGQAGQKQRTLAELGQLASQGDYRGAQAAAFAGGETALGLQLKQMNDADKARLVEQAASWAYGANDPQKWEAGRQQWAAQGFDIGPFQSRDALISQAMTVQDRMRQGNADRAYALDAQKASQTGAPKLVELYDEKTGQPYKAVFNPQTGGYDRVGGTKAPNGTSLTVGPDGQVQFQQGAGIKLTEGQSKDTVFVTRATGALPKINALGDELTSLPQNVLGSLPFGNYAKSPKYQQAEQAGKEFLQAILRKDTGAAITPAETQEYGTVYLPQPGDKPEVLAQKKESRDRAVEAIKAGLPPQAILAAEKAARGGQQAPQGAPQPGEVVDGYRYVGGDPADQNSWEPAQ